MADVLATVLVPVLGALAILALKGRSARFAALIGSTVIHLLLTLRLWGAVPLRLGDALVGADAAGVLVLTLVSVLYCLVAVHLVEYTRRDRRGAPRIFLACHLFSLAAMSLATLSAHWGLFWVAMEATTLASAPLLFYHHGPRSLEATWKYILLGSVGIALALLGTLFLGMSAAASESPNELLFASMIADAGRLSVPWLRMASVFLIVGYGTKMGLAPMHTWKPDAYGEAPPPVAALLSGGLTNCAFLGLLRVNDLCGAAGEGPFARSMLLVLGLLSIGIAAAAVVGQPNYRRLFAYSSVEHMGIVTLALGVGGLASFGGLLHAVNNALNKGVVFLAVGNVLQATGTSEARQVRGLFRTMPWTAAFLTAGFFAATGFPPFGTFISEFTILRGMFQEGEIAAAVMFLAGLAVVFIGMGAIVLEMVQGPPPDGAPPPRRESLAALLPIATLVAAVAVLGVWLPPPLRDLLEAASGVKGGGR